MHSCILLFSTFIGEAHHDFGYDKASRSINLCLYLNEGMTGGETSFVRWRNAETDQGLDMKPEKGKAMIFYSRCNFCCCFSDDSFFASAFSHTFVFVIYL